MNEEKEITKLEAWQNQAILMTWLGACTAATNIVLILANWSGSYKTEVLTGYNILSFISFVYLNIRMDKIRKRNQK